MAEVVKFEFLYLYRPRGYLYGERAHPPHTPPAGRRADTRFRRDTYLLRR